MSRTTLCVVTAAVVAVLSLGIMLVRYQVLGDEVKAPAGPNTYKVTMVVRGKTNGDARLFTACPLDFNRQHVSHETCHSAELTGKHQDGRRGDRRQIQWSPRGNIRGPFQARYEFYCRVDVHRPSTPMSRLADHLYARPGAGEYIEPEPRIDSNHPDISNLALDLTGGLDRPADQARTLFQFVDKEIANEPGAGGPGLSALECLQSGRGDALAQSRLLAALCRNRGIPARLVTGLTLAKTNDQKAHFWVEAWVGDHWMPMCPFHHHCGHLPASYVVFGFGDVTMVRGQNVRNLEYACLVEPKAPPGQEQPAARSALYNLFEAISFDTLPPAERKLAEFLLLLPIAALIICLFRNLVGVNSFGTFAPALIGMAFRDLRSLPGILVFVSLVLIGWGMRRVLDRYHLQQVPRTALLLTLVVAVLLVAILLANFQHVAVTRYFSLFPMVILTGMIERFWTLETEDGTTSSFRTLLGTLFIAASISLFLSLHAVVNHLCRYPETLGLIMAAQLLIGRYTGYRLSELLRFRDFVTRRGPVKEMPTTTQERIALTVIDETEPVTVGK
jgi:hypothetical protein